MKLSSVVTALLVSASLLAVPACKKDKKKADDKTGETTTTPTDKPADTPAGGTATTDTPPAGGDMAKPAEPPAGGEPTEVKKDEAAGAAGGDMAGEKKEGGK
jgi:hypothetical protein